MHLRLSLITLLALAFLFACEQTSLAQGVPTRFLHDAWTTENGLPQNDVTELIQTRDGYIWLATNGGLVRFDGIRFTIFDTGNTPELRSNRILSMSEGPDGTLWIGTQNGGLTSYHRGRFKTYTTKDGLPDDSVDVLATRQGDIWVSTRYSGLGRLTNGRFTVYTTQDGMPTNGAGDLCEGLDGSLWFRSGEWLMRFQQGRFEGYRWVKNIPDDWVAYVSSLRVANDGSLWLTTKYGLLRFQNGGFTVLTTNSTPEAPEMPSTFVAKTYNDRQGELRLITPAGLAHYENGQVVLDAPLPELSLLKIGLWSVMAVLEDREGNVWVGLGGKGLHRFRSRQIVAYNAETGLSDSGFIPITGDGAGGLWLGSIDSQKSLFHFQDGKFTLHDINTIARSLWHDHAGRLWIGTEQGLYQLQDGQLVKDHPLNAFLHYNAIVVETIQGDKNGNLWVGTGGDEGQEGALYRLKEGTITKYQTGQGLIANDVRFIMEDRQGALWVGTTRGLSRFKDEKFTNYTTEQGLSHNYVRDIHEDADGTLWIGTYGGGLNRFKDGRFTHITTANGMFDNVVSRILTDNHGNFWMSCNRGIFRVSRKELNDFAEGRLPSVSSVSYGSADGMNSSETNGGAQPAGWKTADGKLWFPTIRGVVVIDPENLNPLPPPVYIEQVLIGQKPANLSQTVEVRPGQGDLEIHYTGLSFTAPEKVRFKYMLEGYDRDWVDARERRVAYYTQVAPGTYTFRVMAANNDGVWSTQDATIQLTVIPPFWRTWWFTFLGVLGLATVIVVLYKWRIRQLERARHAQEEFSKQLIESQEGERKRIAGELHDSLSQNLVVIKNRAWLSLQEPDNHQNVLEQMEEIADAADQSLSEVREIAYNLRPFQIDRLGLTSAIESLVAKVDSPELRFAAELHNIDKLLPPELEINLYRIVQEGINNIIKHSAATKALIRIERSQDSIALAIQDNGKGFDTHGPRSGESSQGSGFGLIGITERARILGASPVIQSAAGQGTRIEIKLPYERSNNSEIKG